MSLACLRDSQSDSHTCLVDMETIEEEEKEDESQNEKININKIERNLQRRRQIKLAAILLGFVLSLVLLTYSVLVDVNNKKSKYCIALVDEKKIICMISP